MVRDLIMLLVNSGTHVGFKIPPTLQLELRSPADYAFNIV